ncbi:PDZ domain-containing protein [Dethiosulfovibrio sp. F2B]|uniref:type II secretion system protein GspC n=1 Tax=Dethiosulfovibrio faecalis TaxID=2720018 RepID=UPI001F29C479|nr:type II secretion system protein GspC [Dethiosulfovibrio faecalis]MCF4150753.1 PDZ domain-containing protein [Dethiosulfovibrio faecalis]
MTSFTGVFALLGKALPFLGALSLGVTIALFLGSVLDKELTPLIVDARASHYINDMNSNRSGLNFEEIVEAESGLFLTADPFDVSVKPEISENELPPDLMTPEEERVFSVDGIKVVGSLPGVAAWLNEEDKVSLVLSGQKYGGFLLKEVLAYSVVLTKDNVNYEVYISYKDKGESASSKARERRKLPEKTPVLSSGSKVLPASEGSEGVVARELVDSLLMNPFNELKRVRLIPKFVDDKPAGIEVANIMDGSILKELGVQKGDIVKSVNGVVIRNMGDVANAINSLMGGSRFEVAVGRGEKEIMLNYVVR